MTDIASPTPDGTEITPKETRGLATGLIVYGAIGTVFAIGSIAALFVLNGRIGNVNSDVSTRVDTLERTISATSDSLASAATSASGFVTTLGTTSTALKSASDVVGELSPVLETLGNLGSLFGSAGDKLARTSATVTRLSNQLDEVQSTLEKGTIETRVDEGLGFPKAVLIAMTVWLALPAIAALFIGIWLRRAVTPTT